MRIIFLNCWYGEKEKELLNFIKLESAKTDVFCLQEVDSQLNIKLSNILSGYDSFHYNLPVKNHSKSEYGQSVFIRSGLKEGVHNNRIDVFKNRFPNYGFIQQFRVLSRDGKVIDILNFHGRSQPGHKKDTNTRIESSKNIINIIEKIKSPNIILGGDFNLLPETRSIKIIEKSGLLNLISKYSIKTTRNKLAWNEAKDNGKKGKVKFFGKQLFADYCFISKELKVSKFEVPEILVSDHLPMVLETG